MGGCDERRGDVLTSLLRIDSSEDCTVDDIWERPRRVAYWERSVTRPFREMLGEAKKLKERTER